MRTARYECIGNLDVNADPPCGWSRQITMERDINGEWWPVEDIYSCPACGSDVRLKP